MQQLLNDQYSKTRLFLKKKINWTGMQTVNSWSLLLNLQYDRVSRIGFFRLAFVGMVKHRQYLIH